MTHVHTITGKDGFRTSTYMYSTHWNILPTLVCLDINGKEIKDLTLCYSKVWFTVSHNTRHTFTHQTRFLRSFLKHIEIFLKIVHINAGTFCQHYHMIYILQSSIRPARKIGGYSGRYGHSRKSPPSVTLGGVVAIKRPAAPTRPPNCVHLSY